MPVFYRVHARVLKIFSREDVIPGLVDCIRKSAESGADVARVETDLWTHLRPLIDPFYLCGSASCSLWRVSADQTHYTLHIYIPCCLNIAVYVEGKVAAGLKECSAAIVARHLNTEEEVEVLGLPSPLVPDVKAWVAWMQHIHTYTL